MEVSRALLVAIFIWIAVMFLVGCSTPLGWKESITHGGSAEEVKQDLAGTFVRDWGKEWTRNSASQYRPLFSALAQNKAAIALGTGDVKPFNDWVELEMLGNIKNNGIRSTTPGDYLFGRDPYTYPPRYYIMGGKLRLHPTPGQHKYNLYK